MTVAPAAPGPRRAAVVFVFVTVALDVIALGVVIPVLPKLVIAFVGGDTARAADGVECWVAEGIAASMNKYN